MSGRNYFFPANNPYTARPPTMGDLVTWIDSPSHSDSETNNRLERWLRNSPWTRTNLKAALDYTIRQFVHEQVTYEHWMKQADLWPEGTFNLRKHATQWAPLVDGTAMVEQRVRNMLAICETYEEDEEEAEAGEFVEDDEIRGMIVKCAKARWMVRKARKGLEQEIALAQAKAAQEAEDGKHSSSTLSTESPTHSESSKQHSPEHEFVSGFDEAHWQFAQTASNMYEEGWSLDSMLDGSKESGSSASSDIENYLGTDFTEYQPSDLALLLQVQDVSSTQKREWLLAAELAAPSVKDTSSASSEDYPEHPGDEMFCDEPGDSAILFEQPITSNQHE